MEKNDGARVRRQRKAQDRPASADRPGGIGTVGDAFFVTYQPPSTSRKDIEIADAARRAYVARRWHSRRRDAENIAATQHRAVQSKVREGGDGSLDIVVHDRAKEATAHDNQDPTINHVSFPALPLPISGGSIDPFDSTGVTLDLGSATLLQYFQMTWAHMAFQSAAPEIRLEGATRPDLLHLVQGVLADSLVCNAFLAAVAMRMTTVHHAKSRAAQYASLALHELRTLVGSEVANSDRILLTILFLAAFETYCFNLDGTKIHLQALKKMNAQRRLSGYFKSLCQHVDLFSAASSLSAPVFPPPAVLPMLPSSDSPTGQGFFEYVELEDMRAAIGSTIACADAAEHYKTHARQDASSQQELQGLVAQSELLTYQLLQQVPGTLLKECTIIALLMWLSYLPVSLMASTTATPPTPSRDFLKMIPGRGTGLVNRLRAAAPLTTPLHLWILAVGTVCAIDADDTEHCAVAFIALARRLRVTDVRGALRRFLWLDGFDRIDEGVLAQLLGDEEASARALRTVVAWAAATKGGGMGVVAGVGGVDEKRSLVRITRRPSNWFRLGA